MKFGFEGDNMIESSANLDWYKGPTLLEAPRSTSPRGPQTNLSSPISGCLDDRQYWNDASGKSGDWYPQVWNSCATEGRCLLVSSFSLSSQLRCTTRHSKKLSPETMSAST